jgi:hypothetical protein
LFLNTVHSDEERISLSVSGLIVSLTADFADLMDE